VSGEIYHLSIWCRRLSKDISGIRGYTYSL
jgi:hypothetical protein